MLTRIKINGFKSFHDFEMEFTPLTVIAGVNASGKSNLFDALRLLSRLAEVDLRTAFSEQRGNPSELFTQYGEDDYASSMEFEIEMLVNAKVRDNWGGEAELRYTRLRYQLTINRIRNDKGFEDLVIVKESLENLKRDENWIKQYILPKYRESWRPKVIGGTGTPYIFTQVQQNVTTVVVRPEIRNGNRKYFPAQKLSQTVLSSYQTIDFKHILAAKEEMKSWKFMQLNPEDLREPTRQDLGIQDKITSSGGNLAAALFRIEQEDPDNLVDISRTLNSFLPNLTEVKVYDDKANRQFIIKIKAEDGREFSSRVLSEGTLRLLALCILEYDSQHTGLLCFEEPENGIHPYRLQSMAELLKDLSVDFQYPNMPLRQVIVNTHSPVLVGELVKWQQDKNVSVWLSQLNTLITKIKDKKIKLKITKMLPVVKENAKYKQLTILSEEERKLTLAEVIKYLQTSDMENAIDIISKPLEYKQ